MEFKSNAFVCGERKWIAAITKCFVNFWLIFKAQEQKYFFSQIRWVCVVKSIFHLLHKTLFNPKLSKNVHVFIK